MGALSAINHYAEFRDYYDRKNRKASAGNT